MIKTLTNFGICQVAANSHAYHGFTSSTVSK